MATELNSSWRKRNVGAQQGSRRQAEKEAAEQAERREDRGAPEEDCPGRRAVDGGIAAKHLIGQSFAAGAVCEGGRHRPGLFHPRSTMIRSAGAYIDHGSRIARDRMRLASSSSRNCSRAGSHFNVRPVQ